MAALRACGGRRVAEAGSEEVATRGGGLGAASGDGRVGAGAGRAGGGSRRVGAGKKGRVEAGYIVRVCWLLGRAPSTIGPLTVYFGFLGYLRTGTEVIEFNLVTKNLEPN